MAWRGARRPGLHPRHRPALPVRRIRTLAGRSPGSQLRRNRRLPGL